MGNAIPVPNTAGNVPSAHQPNVQSGAVNQVRVSDHHQPPPPRRSSSFLPTLRRRATEPLPQSHRQRYTQRPGETHTRYTYNFNQNHRCSGYTFGFAQRDNECSDDETKSATYRPTTRYKFGFVSNSQTMSSLNGDHCEHGHTNSHHMLDNTRGCDSRHARSRTLDEIHRRDEPHSYTEHIRAMAGQMYGDPPTHSRTPTRHRHTNRRADVYIDSHSHNYAHNQALTRQHFGLWGGGSYDIIDQIPIQNSFFAPYP